MNASWGDNACFAKVLPLIAALWLVASPPGARADLCFHYQISGGGTLVAKGAKLPEPNTCEPLPLFESVESPGLAGAATGSICTDWAGATVLFHYTYDGCLGPPSYFESATCRLQLQNGTLPTTSSTCRGTFNQTGFVEVNDAILESCDGVRVPNATAALCVIRGFSHKPDQR